VAEQTFKIRFNDMALEAMDSLLQNLRDGKDEGDGYMQEFLAKEPTKRKAVVRKNGHPTWEMELTLNGLRHFGEEMAYRSYEANEGIKEGDIDRVNERNACRRVFIAINEIMLANGEQPVKTF
jgi:hypothetical protein